MERITKKTAEGLVVEILLAGENSSMASTWEDYLGISKLENKRLFLGNYMFQILGSIYELIPEDKRFDELGELIVPDEYDGKKITGLSDGEYLETDELYCSEGVEFGPGEIEKARKFCSEFFWDSRNGFDMAWARVESIFKRL